MKAMEDPDCSVKFTKRLKSITFEMVDKALLVLFRHKTSLPNVRIHGDMLLFQANQCTPSRGVGGTQKRTKEEWVPKLTHIKLTYYF